MMISEGGWKLRSYFNRYSAPKFTKFLDDVETIVSVKFRARDIGTQIAHFLDPTFHFLFYENAIRYKMAKIIGDSFNPLSRAHN